jgi:hypothetical protein
MTLSFLHHKQIQIYGKDKSRSQILFQFFSLHSKEIIQVAVDDVHYFGNQSDPSLSDSIICAISEDGTMIAHFLQRKVSKEIFCFRKTVKFLIVSLAQDLVVAIDSDSFLRFISISKGTEFKFIKLPHLARFLKITSHGLILVICVEDKQTFISLFDSKCELIKNISIEETTVACDIAVTPGCKEFLILGYDSCHIQIFDSFSLKTKSEKSCMNFNFHKFVIPRFLQFLFVQTSKNDIRCVNLFYLK